MSKIQKNTTKKVNTSHSPSLVEKTDLILSHSFTPYVLGALYFIVMSVISFSFHKVGDYGVETDFFWTYVPNAKELAQGIVTIDSFRGPMYPIALAFVEFFVGDFFISGMLLALVSASVFLVLSYKVINSLFNPYIALVVVLVTAANQTFVQYTYSSGTDMFFNMLAFSAIAMVLIPKSVTLKSVIMAGVFTGLAYLTRYNGVFLIAGFVIAMLLILRPIQWKNLALQLGAYIAVFFVVITPWGLHTLAQKGSFFFNTNYMNIAYEMYGKGQMSWDQFWYGGGNKEITSLTDLIFRDVGKFFSHIASNSVDNFGKDVTVLMGSFFGIFIVAGVVSFLIKRPERKQLSFLIFNLLFFAILTLVFYSERFSMMLIPFYALLATYPMYVIYQKSKSGKALIPLFVVISAVMVGVSFAKSYEFNSQNIDSGPVEIVQVADWYHANVPTEFKGKKIASRKPHIAYYTNMEFELLPMANSYDELISTLKSKKVDYLYFGMYEAQMRPEYRALLDITINPPGLTRVIYSENPRSVLYRIDK